MEKNQVAVSAQVLRTGPRRRDSRAQALVPRSPAFWAQGTAEVKGHAWGPKDLTSKWEHHHLYDMYWVKAWFLGPGRLTSSPEPSTC